MQFAPTRVRRIAGPLLLALSLVAAGTGCGEGRDDDDSEGGAGGDGKKVAVFLSNGGDPYFQNKAYGYVEAEKKLGVDVELFDAGGYENKTQQIQQVEDAIQRGVDAIVLTPVDSKALCGPIENAMEEDIPVVIDDIMVNCDFKVRVGVSENSVNVGYNECKYMIDELGGNGNMVMLKGPPGAQIAIDRVNGCKKALKEAPGMKVLAEQWGPSNIETGNKLMDDYISAHGKNINAVFTFGAVTALGAVNALQSAGSQPGDVRIATIDFHPEVVKYMKEGWIDGTIPAQPVKLAETAVEDAVKLANGEKVEGESGDPCCDVRQFTGDEEVIDMESLDSYDQSPAVAPEGFKPPLQG
jgi:ribose transport system substrate-binding protein